MSGRSLLPLMSGHPLWDKALDLLEAGFEVACHKLDMRMDIKGFRDGLLYSDNRYVLGCVEDSRLKMVVCLEIWRRFGCSDMDLEVLFATGDKCGIGDWLPQLEEWAVRAGCTRVVCEGRKGWLGDLGKLGYRERLRTFVKRLPDGTDNREIQSSAGRADSEGVRGTAG